ncbi:RecQ family ATP-dependent DNA helicase [Treponema phagedenis]|uniref:RecQ family ATP-dependent DNA helicase n=1 Tax=Treponema phagedenis TaxID=162 RepID=UPI0011E7D1F3|nr:RecQ family ATP-dependent DNA helicase [Treponema phagedenis]QEK00228.1 ATP-dependent DNA helicase RecQ [Treponema phagedenis]QEK00237.1 ATP-dependent DNA helicase RecQ [Treponema phagedenis]QEK07722.1 ATP-dependent DNA helicase RecQ [Treponema phagedenis]QEK07731.1 ATP-dependent DNA helicase RecQ [Treponema phagedenis]
MIDEDFKKFFPNLEFQLRNFQKKVIQNICDNGNTLCLMPTGGGKSIIYWMSAMELGGITIVISPLIALISEQAQKLQKQGYEVLEITGKIQALKQEKLLTDFANKKINPKFIFLSPEKLATDGYLEYCLRKRKDEIKLLAIDEVHCVSQWGASFRPFYLRMPEFLDNMFGMNKWPKILALTATLNPKEVQDICSYFKLEKQNVLKDEVLTRTNIQLHLQNFINENEKTDYFWSLLERHKDEKTLVYVYRKYAMHGVEDLCKQATEKGYKCAQFHGDMNANERMDIVEKFKKNEINVVIATNAFGMGIDIPDIRVVIHYMIPESAEQYYQEIGRAARDGKGANAYLLYSKKNIEVKGRYFIDSSFPSQDELEKEFTELTGNSTNEKAVSYFDDENAQKCIPYFLDSKVLSILCKGFDNLKVFNEPFPQEFAEFYNLSKTKNFITTIKKAQEAGKNIDYPTLAEFVFKLMNEGKLKSSKALDKRLIIKAYVENIPQDIMKSIMKDIDEKKTEKHELLNYFVYLIEEAQKSKNLSNELHQEIGRYLGADKFKLPCIYTTTDGTMVRSKSEVIISNALYAAGIKYKYEEKLSFDRVDISPDFTIYLQNGEKYYWEHIGMLGIEKYDQNWENKLAIYNKYIPDRLLKTYESCALSKDVSDMIIKIKGLC